MAFKFLSDEWYDEVQKVIAEMGGVDISEKLQNVIININAKDSDGGVAKAVFKGCLFEKGHVEAPMATLTAPRETIFKVMVMKNIAEGVRALMTKKAVLGGNAKGLMSLQAVKPSPSQAAFEAKIKAITVL